MHVLVIVAHPKADSFAGALAAKFIRGLALAGHSCHLSDLYAQGFDPVLRPKEWDTPAEGQLAADAQQEQARLLERQALALVYPIWWGTPPAMLQGWLQRVLVPGFAFNLPAVSSAV